MPAALQDCAKQILGLQPITYPPCYKQGLCGEAWSFVCEPGYTMHWKPEWGSNQWWIDALTVDPSKLLEDMKGLWEYGTPQPIQESKVCI